jgi:hypothetical protein
VTQIDYRLRHLAPPLDADRTCYPLQFIFTALNECGVEPVHNPQGRVSVFVTKSISKLRLVRNLARSTAGPVFVPLMGYGESRTLPLSYWTEIVPYCFDCWPVQYERWHSFFVRHRVRLAFFSARESAEHFAADLRNMRSVWLPEAVDPEQYVGAVPLASRTIDVLELGRKNDRYHDAISGHLARTGRTHLFERVWGEIIFPSREAFVAGIGNSKISVCYPCCQTHPEKSGPVETVTQRYFESMASRCILVGHCPRELQDLFGYNPVVEVDYGHESEQLDFILGNLDRFQSLLDRNYSRLLQVGTWTSRIPDIMKYSREIAGASVPDILSATAA